MNTGAILYLQKSPSPLPSQGYWGHPTYRSPPPPSPHMNTGAILYLQKSPSPLPSHGYWGNPSFRSPPPPSPHIDIGAILPAEVPLPPPLTWILGPSYLQKSPSPLPSHEYWGHPTYRSPPPPSPHVDTGTILTTVLQPPPSSNMVSWAS